MPNTARDLARRYLPEPARRRLRSTVASARRKAAEFGREATEKLAVQQAPAARPAASNALVDGLRKGEALPDVLMAELRRQLADKRSAEAMSLAVGLRDRAETADLGRLATGVVACSGGFFELAWSEFREVPAELWGRLAPGEFARSGLKLADRSEALARISELVDLAPGEVEARHWWQILKPVFGVEETELARRVYGRMVEQIDAGKGAGAKGHRNWIRHWIDLEANSPSAPAVPEGRVSFGVVDYGHPDRAGASRNIGDHVQTLASLGHVVRHQGLTYHGPQDLVDLLDQLRSRVRPELARKELDADVQVITIDRDASAYNTIPPNTWTLAFGWFMHPIYGMRFGFPMHDNLLPIFVSFHCNQRSLLTPEAIDYLKKFGPVGCRDWTTVDILLSVGVPAFFSGCLTTTVSTVFPDIADLAPADAPVGYSDVPASRAPKGTDIFKHTREEIRTTPFTTNMYDAVDMLEGFRRDHSKMVTSRLHCYLPVRSLGVPVEFEPKNRADVRFAGLIDITDDEFHAIRTGIIAKLEKVHELIFTGAGPDEVYARWRELTAGDVAQAEERRGRQDPLPAPNADVRREAAEAAAAATHFGAQPASDAVDVAIWVQQNRSLALETLVSSVLAKTDKAINLHLLARHEASDEAAALAGRWPELSVSLVRTDNVGGSLRLANGNRANGRSIDRLLISDLLPDVDRVILLPVESVVLDDIAELADLPLDGKAFAAGRTPGARGASGFGVVHTAALRLRAKTRSAAELRRRMHAAHAFDFDAFNIDVMVLDLALLRERGFVDAVLPLLPEFGLSDREAFHYVTGPDHAALPHRWAVIPTRMAEEDPALVHWADPVKPWQPWATPHRDQWRQRAVQLTSKA